MHTPTFAAPQPNVALPARCYGDPPQHRIACPLLTAAAAITLTLHQRGLFGSPTWATNPKVLNFSDAEASLNGTLPITNITLGRGGAVESIQVHYNGTSTPKRGKGGAREVTDTLNPGEFITEVYFSSDTTYKLVFGLLFRTNLGREFGAGSRSDSAMIKAFPCPVGQYRLAFISGITGGPGMDVENGWIRGDQYLLNLMFYWAPVSAGGKQVVEVVYATDQALCSAPPPLPPPAPPARTAPAGRHWLLNPLGWMDAVASAPPGLPVFVLPSSLQCTPECLPSRADCAAVLLAGERWVLPLHAGPSHATTVHALCLQAWWPRGPSPRTLPSTSTMRLCTTWDQRPSPP
jgi:hypothetical protein